MPGFEAAQVKQEKSQKTENSNYQVQREEKYGNEGGMLSSSISSKIQSKRGSGNPLPPSMLKDYEQKFRRNMDDVRIHQDSESNELNEQMSARAFTIGSDIFLSDSVHPTAGGRDRETLTHEMTHVVQQDGKASSGQLRLGAVDTDQEKEADSVASGESLVNFSSFDTVQRNPDDEDEEEMKGNRSEDERDNNKENKIEIFSKLLKNKNKDNKNNIIEEDKKNEDGEFEINTSRQKGKKHKKGGKGLSGPKLKKLFKNESDSDEIEQSAENNLVNPLSGKGNFIDKIDKKEIKDIFSDDENIRNKKNNPDNKEKKNHIKNYMNKMEKKRIKENYEVIDEKKQKEIENESNIEEMSKLPLAKELTKNQVDKKTGEKGYGIMGRIGSAFGYWALSSLLGLVSKDLASAVVGAMKESGSINEKIENAISKMPLADQNNITIINSDIDSKKKEKETEGKKLQHYRKEAKKLEKSQNMLYAKQLEAMGGQYKTQKGLEEGDFGSLNSYYKSHEKDENTYNKGMESTYEIVDKNDFQVVKQNDKAKQQNNVPVPNKNGNENKPQRSQIKIEENENLEDQKVEDQKGKNKNIISINNNNSVENNDKKIEQSNNIIQTDNNNDEYHKIEPNKDSDEENNEIINDKENSKSQSDNSKNIENKNKENKINNLNDSQRIENSSESNIMSDDKSKKEKEIVQSENSGEKLNEKPENNIINIDTSNKEKQEVNDSSGKKDDLNENKNNKNLININDNNKEKQQGKDNKKEIKRKQDENNPNNVKKEANSKVVSGKKQESENKGKKEAGSEKKKAIQKPGKKSFAETGDVEKYRETMNKVREEETKIDSLDDAIGNLRNTRTKLVKANLDEKDKETVKDQDINDYFENKSGGNMNRFLNKLFGSGKKEAKKEEPKTQVNVNINNNSDAKMETEVKKPGEKNK